MKHIDKNWIFKKIIQAVPIVMILICVFIYFRFFKGITVKKILEFTPENLFYAALIMFGLYALKSMSYFFPMMVLQIAVGAMFPNIITAFVINIIGISIQTLIPFIIGKYAERELVEGIISRYKNASRLNTFKMKNEFATSYFLRIINVLPSDVVSLFLGTMNYSLKNYYFGSMIGFLPGVITVTILGSKITDPKSHMFWIAGGVEIAFAAGSAIYYKVYKNKRFART